MGAAHLARAIVASIAYQVRDVNDAMRQAGGDLAAVRVDGGASAMDLLLQVQADQLRVPVARPTSTETTALGAAMLAGLAEGVWGSLDELAALWTLEREFSAQASTVAADAAYHGWKQAVHRSLGWAMPTP